MRRYLKAVLAGLLAVASSASLAHGEPAMWKASDADSDIWLFGSIHVLDAETRWRTPAFEAAFREADYFYYEALTTPDVEARVQKLVMQLGVNSPGERLTAQLSQSDIALLRAVSGSFGLNVGQLEAMRPWLASITLSTLALQANGYNQESGIERVLQPQTPDVAERFFETAEQQLRLFADLPAPIEAAMLSATLRQLHDEPEIISDMIEFWRSGDTDALDKLLNDSMRDEHFDVHHALIVRRNEAWLEELVSFMAGDEEAMIIVGAGHLVGDQGLPVMLKARGFRVERIQ